MTNLPFRIGDACLIDHTPDTDPLPDAVGVIVGLDASGIPVCRALVSTKCRLRDTASGRELLGRGLVGDGFTGYTGSGPDLSNCTVPDGGGVTIAANRPNLSGAKIRNAPIAASGDWSFADLSRAELWLTGGVPLVGANLRDAMIETNVGHDMRLADATGAVFTNIVAQVIADDGTFPLTRWSMHDAPGSSFNRTDLRFADFSDGGSTRLMMASFVEANLFRANLNGLQCRAFDHAGCDFTRANLREAKLRNLLCTSPGPTAPSCDFTGANLTGADLTGAQLPSVVFDGAIWSNTVCPDGSNSDQPDGDSATCLANLGG